MKDFIMLTLIAVAIGIALAAVGVAGSIAYDNAFPMPVSTHHYRHHC